VLAAAAAAWVSTAHRMAGMDAGPAPELGSVGWLGVSWFVMMAAMTLPAAAPMVAAYGAARFVPTHDRAFAGAYLLTWLAAGLAGLRGHRGRPLIELRLLGAPAAATPRVG
jgi:predicted metal-binding membrane protein